jgi:hypothetical protein
MGTFSVTFTLTVGSSASVGGFNIVGNPGSVSIATGVSRSSLASGVTYSVDDTITEFTITSTGDCTNSVTKYINGGNGGNGETSQCGRYGLFNEGESGTTATFTYDEYPSNTPITVGVPFGSEGVYVQAYLGSVNLISGTGTASGPTECL